jgi:predicted Rossmann fold flavoprotein
MMAAIRAAQLGSDVTLVERNPAPGRKLLLSGKGRCNLTNATDLESFLKRFSKSGLFLRDAFKKFFNRELMAFFEMRGLKLKVERQERVFPQSNSSSSILNVLVEELKKLKVKFEVKSEAKDIIVKDGRAIGIYLSDGRNIIVDNIILATGGISYAFTGSDGAGLRMAKSLGHRITTLRPGLVPLKTKQRYPLEGLTLKNVRIRFCSKQRIINSDVGELLFTHFGISGPLVLTLSGQVVDLLERNTVYAEIDLKPGLTKEQLDARLLREFKCGARKTLKNILKNLLPQKLVEVFADIVKMDLNKKASYITQEERQRLSALFKAMRLDIQGALPIEEAMVTRGGISLKEINPRTMESRLIKGLYFCGEMIDVDADTGGFNLQAAFSTGYLAGETASRDTLPAEAKGVP